MWKLVLFVAGLIPAYGAQAQMDIATMSKGNGLAEIIYKADHCGYTIDQSKLDAYFASNKLDSPEVLSWISTAIDAAALEGAPTPSSCTMAKATARKIGVLSN